MKLREIMSANPIKISPEESLEVAARTLAHYNIGALPVCGSDGRLCGMVTDRDIVTRCLASGKSAAATSVRDAMTARVVFSTPETDAAEAAAIMGKEQIRRLPVVENGQLCGVVSLCDLAKRKNGISDSAAALAKISSNISER